MSISWPRARAAATMRWCEYSSALRASIASLMSVLSSLISLELRNLSGLGDKRARRIDDKAPAHGLSADQHAKTHLIAIGKSQFHRPAGAAKHQTRANDV